MFQLPEYTPSCKEKYLIHSAPAASIMTNFRNEYEESVIPRLHALLQQFPGTPYSSILGMLPRADVASHEITLRRLRNFLEFGYVKDKYASSRRPILRNKIWVASAQSVLSDPLFKGMTYYKIHCYLVSEGEDVPRNGIPTYKSKGVLKDPFECVRPTGGRQPESHHA